MTAAMSPGRSWHWRRWLLVFVLLAVVWLSRSLWLSWLGHSLHHADAVEAVDTVLVLAGDPNTRPLLAAKLVRSGMAKRVLFARQKLMADEIDKHYPPEHDLTEKILLARDVPPDAIVILPEECFGTAEEAQSLANYLKEHPKDKVAVVSSDFHIQRSRLIFARVLGERISQVRFFAAPLDDIGPDNWWTTERGFVLYTTEIIKLVQVRLR